MMTGVEKSYSLDLDSDTDIKCNWRLFFAQDCSEIQKTADDVLYHEILFFLLCNIVSFSR